MEKLMGKWGNFVSPGKVGTMFILRKISLTIFEALIAGRTHVFAVELTISHRRYCAVFFPGVFFLWLSALFVMMITTIDWVQSHWAIAEAKKDQRKKNDMRERKCSL